jgi:hypothetical protein
MRNWPRLLLLCLLSVLGMGLSPLVQRLRSAPQARFMTGSTIPSAGS